MMRSSNPALNDKAFSSVPLEAGAETMNLQGTVNKSGLLLIFAVMTAAWTWGQLSDAALRGDMGNIKLYLMGGAIGGFIVAMITVFKKAWAPITAPIYAVLEGLVLGSVSMMFEMMYPGIVMQAVMLTFGVFFALLFAYTSGVIKATENFKLGVVAATGGIAIVYLISMVLGFFGVNIPLIHESGIVGIGFSLFVVVIAALNLVLDFDFIENGCKSNLPKYMEWYAAFGLLVTLVWLYLEMLRLLSKLQSRR